MMIIKISSGEEVMIDDDDYDKVSSVKWRMAKCGYPYAYINIGGATKYMSMQRFINGTEVGLVTDHKNCDKLDNRKENLRSVTRQQSHWNSPKHYNNKSGYKGVYLDKKTNRWRARMGMNGKWIHLGMFDLVEDAAKAYRKAEDELHAGFVDYRNVA